MTKDFEMTLHKMPIPARRMFIESFPCIECGFTGDPYAPTKTHYQEGCSRGKEMDIDDKNELLEIWMYEFQEYLEEVNELEVKPSERCRLCTRGISEGTVWVAYHDETKAILVLYHEICCSQCGSTKPVFKIIQTQEQVEIGKRWGFAPNIFAEKQQKWKLMNWFEKVGIKND